MKNITVKRLFDPGNLVDLMEYQFYLDNNKWQHACPFILEWPHICVPNMIQEKLVRAHLKEIIDNKQKNDGFEVVMIRSNNGRVTKN